MTSSCDARDETRSLDAHFMPPMGAAKSLVAQAFGLQAAIAERLVPGDWAVHRGGWFIHSRIVAASRLPVCRSHHRTGGYDAPRMTW
jgi:hypothetical protein